MKKLFSYAITIATMLLSISCTSNLELPPSPEEKFATTPTSSSKKQSSSSSVQKSSSSGSNSTANAGTFTDTRDSKTYNWVKIDTQIWMAQNLNYNVTGSKCYNNTEANCNKYGRLYNLATAKNACPTDWHLPTKEEWEKIAPANAGKNLKTADWGGIDAYNFAALPGGYGTSDGDYASANSLGMWWTATAPYVINMNREDYEINFTRELESDLFSVRCVQ